MDSDDKVEVNKSYKSKYKKLIWIAKFINVNLSVDPSQSQCQSETTCFNMFLETLNSTIHIGSTPTFLFDLYLNTAYAAHYVYKSCLLQSVKYKSKVKPFFLTKVIWFQAKDLLRKVRPRTSYIGSTPTFLYFGFYSNRYICVLVQTVFSMC